MIFQQNITLYLKHIIWAPLDAFHFPIGTVLPQAAKQYFANLRKEKVSIPYRYGTTGEKMKQRIMMLVAGFNSL